MILMLVATAPVHLQNYKMKIITIMLCMFNDKEDNYKLYIYFPNVTSFYFNFLFSLFLPRIKFIFLNNLNLFRLIKLTEMYNNYLIEFNWIDQWFSKLTMKNNLSIHHTNQKINFRRITIFFLNKKNRLYFIFYFFIYG